MGSLVSARSPHLLALITVTVVVQKISLRGNIVGGQHCLHTRHREGVARIDVPNTRMRHGTEHQPAKQHALGAKVLGIFRAPVTLAIRSVASCSSCRSACIPRRRGAAFRSFFSRGLAVCPAWLRISLSRRLRHGGPHYSAPSIMASRILL
jgi:hypothetical protein